METDRGQTLTERGDRQGVDTDRERRQTLTERQSRVTTVEIMVIPGGLVLTKRVRCVVLGRVRLGTRVGWTVR